jgi:hypothetical protein
MAPMTSDAIIPAPRGDAGGTGPAPGQSSVERLVHFQCGSCRGWWTIGDAPPGRDWHCPWCGARQRFGVTGERGTR